MTTFDPKKYMVDLKGKKYLPVSARLIPFRRDHPTWSLVTEFIRLDTEAKVAICRCTISDETGRVIQTATKMEDIKGFGDWVEKSETGSVGRALGMIGYGTDYDPEFNEGDRIVDSPVASQDAPRRSPVTETHYAKDAEVPAQAPQRNLLHEARNRFADTAYKLGYEVTAQDGTFAPKLYGDLFRTVTGIEPGKGTIEDWQKARVELEPAPVETAPPADPRNAPAPVMFEDEAQPAPVVPMSPMQGGL